ncbi:hypothetical protein I308_105818 [Cryptococcus tetragattii IND107]|uniref:Uncharacterized protein n=1 Tax=Cryptococcus tetragattii IND107 TaxID=1296105 RepID=A0ABR3BK74_9TREE|nr:hypothetical protein I308_06243 [Cryptococcus tetragattii IND107]
MSTLNLFSLIPLFNLPPSSPQISTFISSLASSSTPPTPDIKTYSDASYHNYYELGLSLCFLAEKGLDSVDIFNRDPNPPAPKQGRTVTVYAPGPQVTIHFTSTTLTLPPRDPKSKSTEPPKSIPRPSSITFTPSTTGRQLVSCLGEPSRKGSGGWTGVWLEWKSVEFKVDEKGNKGQIGIMIELRDPGAAEMTEEMMKKGMGGVWERAANWEWKSLKLFKSE